MFVLPKRTIIIRSADGDTFKVIKEQMGSVPEKFSGTAYFNECVADGLIITVDSAKDSEVHKKIEIAEVREKKARKRADKAAEV